MKKTIVTIAFALVFGAETFSKETCRVFFDLNYDTEETVPSLAINTGGIIPLEAKTYPFREGYRFGGWYTSPECTPEQEWRFGTNSGFYMPATDSMKVEKSMILYAKWVSPTPIRTAQELDSIRNDLYGWYYLENDIDLSGISNWIPIGEYEGNYEFAPGEWWRYAFKGILDGHGHTIRGLRITSINTDKNGLFGTVANGEIHDLKMEDSQLIFEAERPYVAPLAGILKQDDRQMCSVTNCQVTGTVIKVKTTNDKPTFHSFTGLCGGAWGGTVEKCHVSGEMDIEIAGEGGGELYVGPYLGEAYNDTKNCTSNFDIRINISQPQPNDNFKAFIGGLQASATNVDSCSAIGRITISGDSNSNQVYVGGLVGSERYGSLDNSSSTVKMVMKNMTFAQVGGIAGEFNSVFGSMGMLFGVDTTRINECSYTGIPVFKHVASYVFAETVPENDSGNTLPWGKGMDYKIENCVYKKK